MKTKQFKAESKRLLDLMINSIYTHREIFLRELISNASDAMDKLYYKALTEHLSDISREDLGIQLTLDKEARTLTISDNGIGMTEETRTKLFTLFFSSKGKGGTGIGLYVARQVVMQHGGRIEVASVKGEGSTFTVTMPRILAK